MIVHSQRLCQLPLADDCHADVLLNARQYHSLLSLQDIKDLIANFINDEMINVY